MAEKSNYDDIRKTNLEENKKILRELGFLAPNYKEPKSKVRIPAKKLKTPATPKPLKSAALQALQLDDGSPRATSPRRSSRLLGMSPKEGSLVVESEPEDQEPETADTPQSIVENTFGAIDGIPVGTVFESRLESSRLKVHRPTVAGIHGNETEGCYSLALSGGYEDDYDAGESFTYTGEGGRDLKGTKVNPKNLRTASQSKDQTLTRGNLALTKNIKNGRPVRVLRGYKLNSIYAPETGYRYDGLYNVIKFWPAIGKAGFLVYEYVLKRCDDQEPAPWTQDDKSESKETPAPQTKDVKSESKEAPAPQTKDDKSESEEAPAPQTKDDKSEGEEECAQDDTIVVEKELSPQTKHDTNLPEQEPAPQTKDDTNVCEQEPALHTQDESSSDVNLEDDLKLSDTESESSGQVSH